MVIQRDFSDQELRRSQSYDDWTIGMGVNAGPVGWEVACVGTVTNW
jgi:hypothetical protein